MSETERMIGKRKYAALKAYDYDNMDEQALATFGVQFPKLTVADAIKSIASYENKHKPPGSEAHKAIVAKVLEKANQEKPKPKAIKIDKDWLWKAFDREYTNQNGQKYDRSHQAIENIKPLIYYFIGDFESFEKCANVSLISKPDKKKGLLIMGGYGTGKTSSMKALQSAMSVTDFGFSSISANQVVENYEQCANEHDKKAFWNRMTGGRWYFDDVLTEREANNYGKVNLFKDIIEKRYDKGKRTFLTANYHQDEPNNLEVGLNQFASIYGPRVYDRIFEMFNVVEFKGKSFRK